jgi:peptide/nickel transport system substrate-binding protein
MCDGEHEVACETSPGGRLVVGHTFSIPTTNPAVNTFGSTHAYWEAMYNGLVALDEAGNPIPELATEVPTVANGGITDGGSTYVFHLRDDVYWHDDDPNGVRRKLSATDVKFTFEKALLVHHGRTRGMAPALASWDPLNQVASIDVLDPLTIRFRFSHPYAPLLKQLNVTEAPIIPAHLYRGNPSLDTLNANTVGTGAFRFGGVTGSEARLVRNPRYFRAPQPYLEEIIMRPFPDDNARYAALLAGQVDWVWDVPNQFVSGLQANPNFATASTQSLAGGPNSVDQLVFNLTASGDRRGQLGGPDPTGVPAPHPILGGFGPDSPGAMVRRAIAHAVNRDRYLSEGRFGVGALATAPISSELAFHASDIVLPGFDRTAAKALLDDAGWKDEGGPFRVWRGRTTPGLVTGQPLALRFVAPSTIFNSRVAMLDADLAAVGIDLQVAPPGNTPNLVFINRDFDTSIINYAQGYDPHVGVRRQYHSDQVSTTFGTNAAGYKNSAVDADLDQAARTIDAATRFAFYRDFQIRVVDDLPYVWLIETPNVRGYTAKCTGFQPHTGQFAETAYCNR